MTSLENKDSNVLGVKVKDYGECEYCQDDDNKEILKIPWNIWSQWLYISQRMQDKEWGAVFWVKNSTITGFKIPRQEVRGERKPYVGTAEDRMDQLRWLASQFTCAGPPGQTYSDDMILLTSIRDEIASSPVAHQKPKNWVSKPFDWINASIKLHASIERRNQGK